ncbi:hypothetical protein BJF87_12110 [Gordonia sp. CNJ-863]|jgi:alpha-beta hydrolase superfamily lysophospholipase|uniref:Serine aminopeptidase S33 domain-containing protein n=1 Tax=Gordonia alkanivorans CGMCC 6845 TaxID=1423140 RepID=W9DH37_9ACTN|nr:MULTISPECIES: alpha/beta hydrolase [Gordonia]QGP87917.1 alpha/beta hydrolase [Gordonia sp. 135]ETA05585.1 hypothetical protein V525_17495 [Gordonia alkanivorans CGMCC 6845]MDH3016833.1 alpha/beta hydrolase [Gordonia alkanivorans]MDH3020973.1 alpha/beta hydrolase [Gordonia alkanivorans]MDH3026627.1 alpha/beta hydrolase [Gordonia alkanivorans]
MRGLLMILVAIVTAALSVSVAGCSSTEGGLIRLRAVIDGQNTLTISDGGVTTRGVVVFFHGLDRDETILDVDEAHRALVRDLCAAGYVVVAGRAGGNAYGNPASQRHYAAIAEATAERHRVSDVFFLAESMGTIAAVNVMAKHSDLRPRGLAAIGPALTFAQATGGYQQGLAAANPDLPGTDPMRLPVDSLAGANIRFYVSPQDTLVSTAANAAAFRARFGQVATISMVECSGAHLDSSCIRGEDVVSWFNHIAPW